METAILVSAGQSLMSPIHTANFLTSFVMTSLMLVQFVDAAGSSKDADFLPQERRPYQVRLMVAFDSKSFEAEGSQNILHDLELAARRYVGDLWVLKIQESTWLNPVTSAGLERLERVRLFEEFANESADVWFAATVESLPVGSRISVRSWQPEVQAETSIESVDVVDRREVATSLLRLCRDLVRPVGIVEQVTEKSVRIRLRAGEIVSPDPSFTQLKKGDLLMALMAYRGKQDVIERLQTIPWTFITVDDVDGSTVQGTIQSGLKMALGGKKRGRIDTLVVGVRPQHAATEIELLTQSKPPRPLVAHRIEVRTEPMIPKPVDGQDPDDLKSTLLAELLTDRRGQVTVAIDTKRPMVWLFAFSGQNLLARVPFAPGVKLRVTLDVPDDATRLSAEADLQMLQSEVIDAVALRNTAIATIRAAAKKDDWKTVNQKLGLIKRQQEIGSLSDRLTAVRVASIAAAHARKDKSAEVRINRMCDEIKTLIKVHLSDDKVAAISEEMEVLERAVKSSDK
jgi:hypothetical protein